MQTIALGTLKGLVEVNLSNNKLSGTLSADFGELQKLKVLNVRYNHLTHLPSELARCTSLVEVHAGFNRLEELPPELGKIQALKVQTGQGVVCHREVIVRVLMRVLEKI